MKIPEWSSELKFSDNPIDRFIYDQEPAGTESENRFREQLQAIVDYLTGDNVKSNHKPWEYTDDDCFEKVEDPFVENESYTREIGMQREYLTNVARQAVKESKEKIDKSSQLLDVYGLRLTVADENVDKHSPEFKETVKQQMKNVHTRDLK